MNAYVSIVVLLLLFDAHGHDRQDIQSLPPAPVTAVTSLLAGASSYGAEFPLVEL